MSRRTVGIGVLAFCLFALVTAAAGVAVSDVVQRAGVRISFTGKFDPASLPRTGAAPISVAISGQITTADHSRPPQLRRLRIELNRAGRLTTKGLPECPYSRIATATADQALSACRPALVGDGRVRVNVSVGAQEAYPVAARLHLFNGRLQGRPVLYGHVYAGHPFPTSFVLAFRVGHERQGSYGTTLEAVVPPALNAWGRLVGLEMTLSRRYRYRGSRLSVLSAACPAPRGLNLVSFPMARATFAFDGGSSVPTTLVRSCRVRSSGGAGGT